MCAIDTGSNTIDGGSYFNNKLNPSHVVNILLKHYKNTVLLRDENYPTPIARMFLTCVLSLLTQVGQGYEPINIVL